MNILRCIMYWMNPYVERLQIHLPNQHQIWFYKHKNINDIDNNNSKTVLTPFFALSGKEPQSKRFLYREISEH